MFIINNNNIFFIFVFVIMISMIILGFIEMGDVRKLIEKCYIGYGGIGLGIILGCGLKNLNVFVCKKILVNIYY